MGDDRGAVGGDERESQHRTLERQVDDPGQHCGGVAGRGRHRDPHPFRAHHHGRLPARLDGGIARACLQGGAQDVDFDVVAVCPPGLTPRPQVGLTDEPGDKHRRGPVVDLRGSTDLLDMTGVHHRDPVAHRQGFLLVVGHVDERDPDLALNSFEFELHDVAEF